MVAAVHVFNRWKIIRRERKEQEQTPAEIRNTSGYERFPRVLLPELTKNLKNPGNKKALYYRTIKRDFVKDLCCLSAQHMRDESACWSKSIIVRFSFDFKRSFSTQP